jgi:hypothetical protein
VGALPSLSSLPSRNNEEKEEGNDNVRGGGELGSDQAHNEMINNT